MPNKIIFIIGLPGSGKTTLGEKMLKKDPTAFLLDDPSMKNKNKNPKHFFDHIPIDKDVVIISDPYLVTATEKNLKDLVYTTFPKAKIEFICFENNPQQCYENIQERNKKSFRAINKGFLSHLSQEYDKNISSDFVRIPVFKPKAKKLKSKLI